MPKPLKTGVSEGRGREDQEGSRRRRRQGRSEVIRLKLLDVESARRRGNGLPFPRRRSAFVATSRFLASLVRGRDPEKCLGWFAIGTRLAILRRPMPCDCSALMLSTWMGSGPRAEGWSSVNTCLKGGAGLTGTSFGDHFGSRFCSNGTDNSDSRRSARIAEAGCSVVSTPVDSQGGRRMRRTSTAPRSSVLSLVSSRQSCTSRCHLIRRLRSRARLTAPRTLIDSLHAY